MLTQIHIQHFTLIEQLELDLDYGMTVITGETGAGKSITIDALDLVLGGRADVNVIKQDKQRCDITANFDISKIPSAQNWLIEHDLICESDCILRRIISRDGRNKNYINGQPTTVQALRELGELLVNIHGQHEHQLLLKREEQRRMVDNLAGHADLLDEVAQHYHEWQKCLKLLTELQAKQTDKAARTDWLRYQLQEFEKLSLRPDELPQLEQEQKQLAHAGRLLETTQLALNLLSEADAGNAAQWLHQACNKLDHLTGFTAQLTPIIDLLRQAEIQLNEAVTELSVYSTQLELNPDRLEEIEQRLQAIHDLARKHRVSPEELWHCQQTLQEELQQLEQSDIYLDKLQQESEVSFKQYQIVAKQLSVSRAKAAQHLAQQVSAQLSNLGIQGGQLEVSLIDLPVEQYSPQGLERIEFLVRTNPGQPLQPLQKVASGGELSRISLAIQVVAASQDDTPTLVFDEVDVGVGGATAAVIGQLLRNLSKKAQVLCITHLPQVAAYGTQHFTVEKSHKDGINITEIKALTQDARIKEIGRMLGGLKMTKQTLAHAKELLESATIA